VELLPGLTIDSAPPRDSLHPQQTVSVVLLRWRGDVMPGDPKECRRRAARCAELAVATRTPQLRATFLELSKKWEKLAIQLENAFALLVESEDIGVQVGESLDETKRLSGSPLRKLPYSET
jgi:hypothetical protein